MKFFSNLYLAAAAALVLSGCASDVIGPDSGSEGELKGGPGVYIGVNFRPSAPGSTRGYTNGENSSNNGIEEGTDVENNVNELIIVLARATDNGFIAASTVTKENLRSTTVNGQSVYNAVAKVYTSYLDDYYEDTNITANNSGNRDINVFVFCNPTGQLAKYLDGAKYGDLNWVNLGCSVEVKGQVTNGAVWSTTMGGQFLMSNRDIATREIPGTVEGWNAYSTSDKAFNLSGENGSAGAIGSINNASNGRGAVLVERAAARIDFRDGSPEGTEESTYPVVYIRKANGEIDNAKTIVSVQLQKMSLVNMSNQFYYIPRVSPTGMNEDVTICGPELPWFSDENGTWLPKSGNYVVDFDAGKYTLPLESNFAEYFNYPFFNEDGTINNLYADGLEDRWGTVNISDILDKDRPADNWDNNGKKGTYKVWRYLTENTVWGVSSNQMNGNTTGIVFKGRMIGNKELLEDDDISDDAKEIIEAINRKDADFGDTNTAPIIYTFGEDNINVYLTWEKVVEAAIKTSFSYTIGAGDAIIPDWNRTNTLYEAVFGNGGTGYELKDDDGKVIYTDPDPMDPNSANAQWLAWHKAGHPSAEESDLVKKFKAAATGNNGSTKYNDNIGKAGKFTIYQRSEDLDQSWGYYSYYYYWIHHNDNGNDGVMAPMELAVVRNNVYKLAVTKLGTLGHPRLTENDPEPPTPDTPDETSKVYLKVETQVVPWVVRVKDIVFD